MKRSLILLIAISVALPCAVHAAGPSKSRIAAIEKAYKAVDDLTAGFTQKTKIELLDKTVTKRGLFQYRKGGRLRIEYKGKNGKHYVPDGTTIWTYVPGDESSLDTFAVDDRTIPKEALSFLGGFGKLTKEFKVSESTAFKRVPEGAIALHLVPHSRKAQYEWLDALFGPDNLLRELIVKNESGNVSRYSFSDIRTNTGLADRRFTLSTGKATPDTLPE